MCIAIMNEPRPASTEQPSDSTAIHARHLQSAPCLTSQARRRVALDVAHPCVSGRSSTGSRWLSSAPACVWTGAPWTRGSVPWGCAMGSPAHCGSLTALTARTPTATVSHGWAFASDVRHERNLDFVVASEAFEHVAALVDRVFRSAAHLLRPDDVCIVTVPFVVEP